MVRKYELVILFYDERPEWHRYYSSRDDALRGFGTACAAYPDDAPGKSVDVILYCNADTSEYGEVAARIS